jgi:hypothetical protein
MREKFRAAEALKLKKKKENPSFSANARMSALEKDVGKRKNPGMTVDEQIGASRQSGSACGDGGSQRRRLCTPMSARVCVHVKRQRSFRFSRTRRLRERMLLT